MKRFLATLKGVIMLNLYIQKMHLSQMSNDMALFKRCGATAQHKRLQNVLLPSTPIRHLFLGSEDSSVHISHTTTSIQSQTHAVLQQICFILKSHYLWITACPMLCMFNDLH